MQNLRSHGYGGARDWKLVFETHVKAMGRVEGAVHKHLAAYAAEDASYRGGEIPSELFDCTISAAIETVKAEI